VVSDGCITVPWRPLRPLLLTELDVDVSFFTYGVGLGFPSGQIIIIISSTVSHGAAVLRYKYHNRAGTSQFSI
jgi:hypothetical protein